MTTRSTILEEMKAMAQQQKKTLAPLHDDTELLKSGLDSLCFAILVAKLEDRLGIDPFSMAEEMEFPVTLGDFIAIYENAAERA